jgi:pimeloyl-ACP methyl ester carboxylesterase
MLLAHEVHGPLSGPAVVLVHGITESRRSWDPLIDDLATDLRVLAVDLRGHGDSDPGDGYDPISYASDVVETMRHHGIEAPVAVGHSLGGVVVSAMAALGAVRSVVNVDQSLRLSAFKEGLTPLEPTK